jgi:hypothetical protein
MHVDGGVKTQMFVRGAVADFTAVLAEAGIAPDKVTKKLYIIRNGRFWTGATQLKPRVLSIAGRAIDSMLLTSGVSDAFRIYLLTAPHGTDFNLASIPEDYVPKETEMFDPVEMQRLYDLAFEAAKSGYPWRKLPPYMTEKDRITPK